MTTAFDVNRSSLEKGILLLEASAGTGKTWALTSLAVRLLLEGRVDSIDRLLLVTFTNAATDELRQRLRQRLHDAELVLRGQDTDDPFLVELSSRWRDDGEALRTVLRARRDVDLARVRTIHGFCLDVLAEGAFEAGLPLDGAEQTDGSDLLRTAWRDTLRDTALSQLPFVSAAMHLAGLTEEDLALLYVARRWPAGQWRPERRELPQAAADFAHFVAGMDFSLFAQFVAGGPDKDWSTAYRNQSLRAARALGDGPVPARLIDQLALLRLTPARLSGDLNKSGKQRFEGSELEAMLVRMQAAFEPLRLSLQQTLCARALERYGSLKDRLALIDYDDVIARTRARLEDGRTGAALARRIAGQFQAALVDEFQDTDADQWAIFRRLFSVVPPAQPEHLLVLVGDPKQAIYRFRGADIFAYLAAREAANRTETLTHNWRSTPALVDAVNSVFGHRPDESFALPQIGFEPVEAGRGEEPVATPMDLVWVDPGSTANQAATEAAVLDQLAADILRRRRELDATPRPGTTRPRLAVLVFRHRQARAVMRRLRQVGVDVVLARGGDVHASEAMTEWRVILRALLDPSDLRLQRRARATRIWGTPLSGLAEGAATFEEVALLVSLARVWSERGVATMASELIAARRTVFRWLGEEGGERMVTDLRHSIELLNREEGRRGLGPEALIRWAEAELVAAHPDDDERLLRLDRESDAVQVLTNFTSKGLQFDSVYLPYAWFGRKPGDKPPFEVHAGGSGQVILDFAGDAELQPQALLEDLASSLRMHYVELTRAMERCVVYLAPLSSKFPYSASAFLLARDDGKPTGRRTDWASAEVGGLVASVGEAAGRIEKRLEGVASIRFRRAQASAGESADWPRPALQVPEALAFPARRRFALAAARQLSYTALVRSLKGELAADPAAADLPLADRADPADATGPHTGEGIFGFARGARAGICLHELLEHTDFAHPAGPPDEERIQLLLQKHGLDAVASHPGAIEPVDVCLALIGQIRREQLPFSARLFGELDPASRIDEWEFRLPVVDLVPRDLARLVAEHWHDEEWILRATERLERLPDRRLQGMLGGFVDLLFVDEGRWCLLDWKSNDLGPRASDYTLPALQQAMVEHDYLVQLLLYTVAVHRFLRSRLPDYDYERHVAGASYVFLRGLSGDPRRGWCNVRPPRALVEAIDGLFAGEPS